MKRRHKQTQFDDSMTGVNPKRSHGFGIYKSERVVWSVRVDKKLLAQAKPLLKAKFGSECRAVEVYLAGLVSTQKGSQLVGVNPGNTVSIGKLVVERNIRTRRKLVVEEETIEKVKVVSCGFCRKEAVGAFKNKSTGTTYPVCEFHGNMMLLSEKWVKA